MEQATGDDQRLGRGLDVQDPGAGGHPLGGAVGDHASATGGVLVLHRPVDHVGHGLEAAVRVPRGALGLARRVLDLAHLVHVDEGVEQPLVHARERAADREALALEATRGRRHRQHGPVGTGRRGGQLDARKGEQVVHGDCRHVDSSRSSVRCYHHQQ